MQIEDDEIVWCDDRAGGLRPRRWNATHLCPRNFNETFFNAIRNPLFAGLSGGGLQCLEVCDCYRSGIQEPQVGIGFHSNARFSTRSWGRGNCPANVV